MALTLFSNVIHLSIKEIDFFQDVHLFLHVHLNFQIAFDCCIFDNEVFVGMDNALGTSYLEVRMKA